MILTAQPRILWRANQKLLCGVAAVSTRLCSPVCLRIVVPGCRTAEVAVLSRFCSRRVEVGGSMWGGGVAEVKVVGGRGWGGGIRLPSETPLDLLVTWLLADGS